jgi:cyclohexanone monooxygenase
MVVKTDTGEEIRARYCVMAAGNLSTPRVPDFKGLQGLQGQVVPLRPVAA